MKLQILKSTLPAAPTRPVNMIQPGSWRTDGMGGTARGYGYKWQQARSRFLRAHPLCVMCEQQGQITAASVVDHRIPHRGDMRLFWDEGNWQSLCATHHSSDKQREENALK